MSLFCYQNLVDGATVTVTSESTNRVKENAYDGRSDDWWQAAAAGTVYFTVDLGSAQPVDYWSVAFHDLNDNSGTIKPQSSTTGAWAGEELDFDTVQTPLSGNGITRKVNSVSARYWRFEISSAGSASNIGHLSLGAALTSEKGMRVGYQRPRHGNVEKLLNNETEGGNISGSSLIRRGYENTINLTNLTQSWVDANWDALEAGINGKLFSWVWDEANYPSEVAFFKAVDIDRPKYTHSTRLSATIKCRGLL